MVPQGGVGCELGVSHGINAAQLLHRCNPVRLHLVDTWPNKKQAPKNRRHGCGNWMPEVKRVFRKEIESKRVSLHRCGSIEYLRRQPAASMDWVYLDSCHQWAHFKNELPLAITRIKKGGYVMGHDFCTSFHWKASVVRAVVDACQKGRLQMVAVTCETTPSYLCLVK